MKAIERFNTTASSETIWQILADVEHWKDWTPTILEISPLSDGGFKPGARYRVLQPGLRPAVFEVTACTPNQAFTWVQKLPGGGFVAEHKIAASSGWREVELSFYSTGLLAGLASTLYSSKIREFVAKEAQGLKAKCEALQSSISQALNQSSPESVRHNESSYS